MHLLDSSFKVLHPRKGKGQKFFLGKVSGLEKDVKGWIKIGDGLYVPESTVTNQYKRSEYPEQPKGFDARYETTIVSAGLSEGESPEKFRVSMREIAPPRGKSIIYEAMREKPGGKVVGITSLLWRDVTREAIEALKYVEPMDIIPVKGSELKEEEAEPTSLKHSFYLILGVLSFMWLVFFFVTARGKPG